MERIGPGAKPIITPEGGLAVYFINKTGANSIKGTLVNTEASVDFAVNVVTADEPDIIGVIYEDGIPDGDIDVITLSFSRSLFISYIPPILFSIIIYLTYSNYTKKAQIIEYICNLSFFEYI